MNFRIQCLKTLSAFALLYERLMDAFWRFACWIMAFTALWLFEIPALFGNVAAVATTLIALGGAAYFLYRDLPGFRWPSMREVERRMEERSAVLHRPLSGRDDKPISNTGHTLWQREASRRQRLLSALKPAPPQAILASKAPRALRLGVFMALLCGLIVAGSGWKPRLVSGLFPAGAPAFLNDDNAQVTLWITPPDYTGAARIIPVEANSEPLQIPQGSILKAFIKSGVLQFLQKPSIRIDRQSYPLSQSAQGTYTIEMEIPQGSLLSLRSGVFKTLEWDYELIIDTPPQLSMIEPPKTLPDSQLQFSLNMMDDYGVQNLEMLMQLDPVVIDAPLGSPVEDKRSVISPPGKEFQMTPVYDLTAHPWAGLPVIFTFTASDHVGQATTTELISLVLPERVFTHPVAKKLIEIRKYIAWNPESNYTESGIALEGLMRLPQAYGHDRRVFLALRVAASRLYHNTPSVETSQSVMALLWDTALRLEDGNLSLAARDLRDAQQALERALQNPESSDADIAALMNRLREAMAEYLQSLAREWNKRIADGESPPQLPPDMLSNMMNMQDLAGLMDRMESEMLSGDRNAAQEMLSKLQRLMDMVNPSMSMSLPPDMQMMQEGISELQKLIEGQEALREQTVKQADLYNILKGLGVNKTPDQSAPPFINTSENQTESRP